MFLKVIILKGAYFKIWHYLSTQGLEGDKIGEMKTFVNIKLRLLFGGERKLFSFDY